MLKLTVPLAVGSLLFIVMMFQAGLVHLFFNTSIGQKIILQLLSYMHSAF